MIFLLAIAFVLIGYLNPFLAIVYGVGMTGDRLLKSGKMHYFFLTALASVCLLRIVGYLNNVDFFELVLLVLMVFVYFYLLLGKGSYDIALLGAGVACFVGEALIFAYFHPYYQAVIQRSFSLAGDWVVGANQQEYLEVAQSMYSRNYPSLYAVLGLCSFYLGSILLGRKAEIPEFEFRKMVLPYWVDICLLGGLVFFVFRNSLPWPLGSNLLIFFAVAYMLVGMGVVFTIWQKWFERSKILYFLFIVLLVINKYLLFVLSFLGLLERWFDFRKLNRRKDESDFN